MRTVTSIPEMRAAVDAARKDGNRIGLVPTMGFLHEGHLSLVRKAKGLADVVVVSIFVNPAQFGPQEDFEKYPRDRARDEQLCGGEGVDMVFVPSAEEMYAGDRSVWVDETSLSAGLCGASRPAHFRGVMTVVAKLFNIVQPDLAVFGMKDAQQVRVIQRMVRDLDFPVEVVAAPIVREPDGLAMSSRNRYLSPAERIAALSIYRSLCAADRMYGEGERSARALKQAVSDTIHGDSLVEAEYIEVVGFEDLQPVAVVHAATLIAIAARLGNTRLIDNVVVGPS